MKKIYVVTQGEYSDAYVSCVFSDEKKASEYSMFQKMKTGENCFYETFVIDDVDLIGDRIVAFVSYATGAEIDVYPDLYMHTIDNAKRLHSVEKDTEKGRVKYVLVHGFGKDKDHALKAARDNRAKLLAEQAGIS